MDEGTVQDHAAFERRKAEIIATHGVWTAMAIDLGNGRETLPPAADWRLARIVSILRDVLRRPLQGQKVLDLACLEGHYTIEPVLGGAEGLGIEGREANLAKACFAAETLGLDRCRFVQDDVRNLSASKYGTFDVVIASGIVYHLDAPDALDFIASVAEVCTDLAIVDTYVSARPEVAVEWRGRTYHGRYYTEHAVEASSAEKEADRWASIDNVRSFWLTRSSLVNLLGDVGFATVLQCLTPAMNDAGEDRITLVALKGPPVKTRTSPETNRQEKPRWPEILPPLHPSQDPRKLLRKRIGRLLPPPIRRRVKSILQATGLMREGDALPWHRGSKERK